MAVLSPSGSLWRDFDSAWYRYAYPIVDELVAEAPGKTPLDVYTALVKPLRHSPNPFFNEAWYLERYKGVAKAVEDGSFLSGLDHYCQHGRADLMPHWLFEPAYYRERFLQVQGRKLDDELDGDPYDHFLRLGQHRGLTGHWLFDPAVYAATAPFDVASRIARFGAFTTLLFHLRASAEEPVASNLFDFQWYKVRYPNVEREIVDQKWDCALHHYLANNDGVPRDPSPRFSETIYLSCWPEVARAVGLGDFASGFAHYMLHGHAAWPSGGTIFRSRRGG